MNPYRVRLWSDFRDRLAGVAPFSTALDFGSGDGWFAKQMTETRLVTGLTAVDVLPRPGSHVTPVIYDGVWLPFPDQSFDLVYAVDVFHHCPDPAAALRDALRCCGRYFLLKDHTYRTAAGRLALAALDEIGNRKFGVPSLYKYQRGWDWVPIIEGAGFRNRSLAHPVRCHTGLLGTVTNRLQFVGLWERVPSS